MGSSGAYTVALLKSLALGRRTATTPQRLAEGACEIEIDILKEPVGKQDQYVAAHGGICAYTFHQSGEVDVRPLTLAEATLTKLRNNFLLFWTGESRSASKILSDQVERTESDDEWMVENLHRTKEIGLGSVGLLESGDIESYAELMHEHWVNKRQRSPGIGSERIDDLYTLARRSGCLGGKLVGADGGGFLLVYAMRPEDTRLAMTRAGTRELTFDFEFEGCVGSLY